MSEEETIDFFALAESMPKKRVGTNLHDPKSPTLLPGKVPSQAQNVTSNVTSPIENVTSPLDVEAAKKALETPVMRELMAKAEHLIVDTLEDAELALSMQDQAHTFAKQVEETRKQIVRPHLDFQKAVKAFADDLREQFECVRQVVTDKLDRYCSKVGHETGVNAKLANEDATASQVTEWLFEIKNPLAIPIEYLMPNEKAIKQAIKEGVREIDGLRIYSETKTKYKSKPKRKVT